MMNILTGKVPNVELTAVCDIRPDRLAFAEEKAPEVARYLQFDELIASGKADALLIATPHYFHPPMAIAAFQAGLHVLTEKPAGVRVSDVTRMMDAADRSGKVFGIMYNQRTGELFHRAALERLHRSQFFPEHLLPFRFFHNGISSVILPIVPLRNSSSTVVAVRS
jgi:predicted dehydrogenase